MKIAKELIIMGMTIALLVLLASTNVYAKQSQSATSISSSSGTTGLSTTTTSSGYAVKPGAFLSKCTFNSNAVSDLKNVTNIAFNQHDLEANHWDLKPSANGPTSGAYLCILEIVPNRP